jgi:hypothetical protein
MKIRFQMDAHDNKSLNCDTRVKTMQLFWRFSLSPNEHDESLLNTPNYNLLTLLLHENQ